jgi:hypothetical protein
MKRKHTSEQNTQKKRCIDHSRLVGYLPSIPKLFTRERARCIYLSEHQDTIINNYEQLILRGVYDNEHWRKYREDQYKKWVEYDNLRGWGDTSIIDFHESPSTLQWNKIKELLSSEDLRDSRYGDIVKFDPNHMDHDTYVLGGPLHALILEPLMVDFGIPYNHSCAPEGYYTEDMFRNITSLHINPSRVFRGLRFYNESKDVSAIKFYWKFTKEPKSKGDIELLSYEGSDSLCWRPKKYLNGMSLWPITQSQEIYDQHWDQYFGKKRIMIENRAKQWVNIVLCRTMNDICLCNDVLMIISDFIL